jgi:hypothetical protein
MLQELATKWCLMIITFLIVVMVPAFLMDEEVDFDLELMHVVAE